jgi:hypothetical protein
VFEAELHYKFIPILSSSFIVWKCDQRRLWYNTKNMQTTQLAALEQPLGALLRLMWLVLQMVVNEVRTSLPVTSFEEVNFVPLLPQPLQEAQWNARAQNVINIAKFFIFALEERTRKKGVPEPTENDDLLMIETDG